MKTAEKIMLVAIVVGAALIFISVKNMIDVQTLMEEIPTSFYVRNVLTAALGAFIWADTAMCWAKRLK